MNIKSLPAIVSMFVGLTFFASFTKIAAQEIINIVMVGDEGITEDAAKAHSFIVIKSLGDHLERLDYKKGGPVVKIRTYKDSLLQILDGRHLEYFPSGYIHYFGHYTMNRKSGDWRTFNDTGKIILTEKYQNDILIKSENPDTIREVKSES